ncbi:MAG: DUF1622 domain-containing protein [Chloroflexi bacterium]|nr:DUF1622 domain-containing protein [Chloroflexota bacterium]
MPDFYTLTHDIEDILEMIGVAFDVFGVCVICVGIILAFVRYFRTVPHTEQHTVRNPYRRLKIEICLALLLGLEVLVAADIIKTVALEPSFDSLGVLGLLVIIRTFLSWTLVLEIEGHWPWQGGEGRVAQDLEQNDYGEDHSAQEGSV